MAAGGRTRTRTCPSTSARRGSASAGRRRAERRAVCWCLAASLFQGRAVLPPAVHLTALASLLCSSTGLGPRREAHPETIRHHVGLRHVMFVSVFFQPGRQRRAGRGVAALCAGAPGGSSALVVTASAAGAGHHVTEIFLSRTSIMQLQHDKRHYGRRRRRQPAACRRPPAATNEPRKKKTNAPGAAALTVIIPADIVHPRVCWSVTTPRPRAARVQTERTPGRTGTTTNLQSRLLPASPDWLRRRRLLRLDSFHMLHQEALVLNDLDPLLRQRLRSPVARAEQCVGRLCAPCAGSGICWHQCVARKQYSLVIPNAELEPDTPRLRLREILSAVQEKRTGHKLGCSEA